MKTPRWPPSPRQRVRARQLALAFKRIGKTANEHLRWLLDFAERDLDEVPEGARTALSDEVIAFAAAGDVAAAMYAPDFEPVSGDELQRLQERISRRLAILIAEQTGRFLETVAAAAEAGKPVDILDSRRLPPIPETVSATPAADDPDVLVVSRSRGWTIADLIRMGPDALANLFEQRAVDVLMDSRPRPRRCRECGRLFAPRGRQLRHPKCSQRARDRNRTRALRKPPKKGA